MMNQNKLFQYFTKTYNVQLKHHCQLLNQSISKIVFLECVVSFSLQLILYHLKKMSNTSCMRLTASLPEIELNQTVHRPEKK